MIRVGLTGGIASGKSTLVQVLKKEGIPVIDADEVAREVLFLYPEILDYLARTYGEPVVKDGVLNRRALGKIIFSDPEKRRRYNAVIMPRIREEVEKRFTALDTEPLVVLDAPLLFEENFHGAMDAVITVTVDAKTQLKRLMARDGFSREEAQARVAAQMDLAQKAAQSDYVVDNGGSREESARRLNEILERIRRDHGKTKEEETPEGEGSGPSPGSGAVPGAF